GRGASTADTLLAAGLDALGDAEPGRAAVALGLALRSDPSCAVAIITAVDEAGTFAAVTSAGEASPGSPDGGIDPGLASLAVVHGDALRAAGRDDEAVLAYDLARQLAAGIGETVISPAAVKAEPAPAGEDGGPPLAGGSA
ncbi:MAG: hypothetical protein MUC54_02790, partial [Chloroflexi bacterium]|nr:hypothetical protein [Chloroflexota bacterium]